jgi:protein-L-isoaspartate(D-aspartate) O-methyltransferase
MDDSQSYQQSLLQQIETSTGEPIKPALRQAFADCPRHLFIPRYLHPLTQQWCEVSPENLDQHLAFLYADMALTIYQQPDTPVVATISQPLLVLKMLDLLDIQPGASVFEIGTGSGWNAGLMGKLVGKEGHVYSMEILTDLVASSQKALKIAGIEQVSVLEGDSGAGYIAEAPFDRIIFTAGAYDIPLAIHQQLKEGGRLAAVVKIPGGGDDLILLKKQNGILVSESSTSVRFIPMLGNYRSLWLDGIDLAAFLDQKQLNPEGISSMPFWWGNPPASPPSANFMSKTRGVRSFLHVSEPGYRVFTTTQSNAAPFFGVYDEPSRSLVVAQDDILVSYGNLVAQGKLLDALTGWIKLGMPSSDCLQVAVYPKTGSKNTPSNGWVVERDDSVFVWQLKAV